MRPQGKKRQLPNNTDIQSTKVFLPVSFNLLLTVQLSIFAAQEYIMRKIFVILIALIATVPAFSQENDKKKTYNLAKHAADHFMIQFATFNMWTNAPDSISNHIKGFQRSANVYVMLDKALKSDQRFSIAGGIGVGTTNIYFDKMLVDLASPSLTTLQFIAVDTTIHYKKYKVSTAFIEAPIEFRFTSNPETPNKAFKGAIGIKFGTLISSKNKGKFQKNILIHSVHPLPGVLDMAFLGSLLHMISQKLLKVL